MPQHTCHTVAAELVVLVVVVVVLVLLLMLLLMLLLLIWRWRCAPWPATRRGRWEALRHGLEASTPSVRVKKRKKAVTQDAKRENEWVCARSNAVMQEKEPWWQKESESEDWAMARRCTGIGWELSIAHQKLPPLHLPRSVSICHRSPCPHGARRLPGRLGRVQLWVFSMAVLVKHYQIADFSLFETRLPRYLRYLRYHLNSRTTPALFPSTPNPTPISASVLPASGTTRGPRL